jgi:hypothetical protein
MASIKGEIFEKFYSKLAKSEGFDEERVVQLRAVFSGKKKPEAPDVIKRSQKMRRGANPDRIDSHSGIPGALDIES